MAGFINDPTYDWDSGCVRTRCGRGVYAKPKPGERAGSTSKILSGTYWSNNYPSSQNPSALLEPFRSNVEAFIKAIEDAGGHVKINATYRSPETAWLMHYAYKIARGFQPKDVRAKPGVNLNIEWDHGDYRRSQAAARAMCLGFKFGTLGVPPSVNSRHISRKAIDMTIIWEGALNIARRDGTKVNITTLPRSGMNHELALVGETYDVWKAIVGSKDRPHWSSDGH